MSKADVELSKHSQEEIEAILRDFGLEALVKYDRLFGGFSGSNYRVQFQDGSQYVLKICNGYDKKWVDDQCAIQNFIRGVVSGCTPCPLKDGSGFVSTTAGTPSCLLSFVHGKTADKVVEAGTVSVECVLRGVGEGLASVHAIPVGPQDSGALRSYLDGGACFVGKHVKGEYDELLKTNEYVKDHPFVQFYLQQALQLREHLNATGLPLGVLHGDPFLDNVMVHPDSGAFVSFVDWEDTTIGPLLFDVACCIIGTCFRATDNKLDKHRLSALLLGYTRVRPLSQLEQRLLVPFMKLTLLCNASFRFINFNIEHREIEGCRDAYKELQQRIEDLERSETEELVTSAVSAL